ncbi:pyruvate carboxylase [Eremococcus coleocola]|uniref:Pyruvate carboxylase n=1 Tax=Eremococcus coleocola ACS-139-V-Col8 TaxID=908337 RepID=E4KQ09_9LACT|nr:pyruvate carboxylase [Eremococcus coleocola]EFR31191.1 pyruvate carboxylase [Eremococcus coleocola ACS-139-V-Col8]
MNKIHKLLIANRGEIATRIIRASHELGIETIAIYSKEDVGALHRQKADYSYLIGEDLGPIEAYLDIEGIINLAKEKGVDAIHPGYGFLSENQEFAQRCAEEGIIFVGPQVKHLQMFGNKTQARETALAADLPVIPGSQGGVASLSEVKSFVQEHGYPIMIKAVNGGGGKGMRIVRQADELEQAYDRAKSEAKTSFGDDSIYVERYVENPKHIEVQIIGDQHGNLVHLFERDCSIQRRHQKVVEIAPSFNLSPSMRDKLTRAALQLMNHIGYENAGTVEFLVAGDDYYFIEVNPRVQVEHTVTELITGIDIVKSQILIADGEDLFGPAIHMPHQTDIQAKGFAIQCRITTEDPLNNFSPDSGKIIGYHSPGGAGIRLDAGDAYGGAQISPFYDSLLVKVSSYSRSKKGAIEKMQRALSEIRLVGLKTNIRFLENILKHPEFNQGDFDTTFIDNHPELFEFVPPRNRGVQLLKYIANVSVNGFPGIKKGTKPDFPKRIVPEVEGHQYQLHKESLDRPGKRWLRHKHQEQSYKHLLDQAGPQAVVEKILAESTPLLTDTTLRDAHQSLLGTRLRTSDMLLVAPFMNETMQDYFSLEMWGGATFDVAYNFLKESPWQRLQVLRQAIPDIPFQMLLRASNAVGYKNYPDNLVATFIAESAKQGIDVFRIFDSLNWLESLKLPIEKALETGKLVEGTICYTGDILNPNRSKVYTLDYYVKLAKELEKQGVHVLALKDMAGLLKPEAAYQLIKALKSEVKMPIHLHTHDTTGNGIMTYSRAIDAGVDIVDTANAALSGQNSQPNTNSLFYARQGNDRQLKIDTQANESLSNYWKITRNYYQPFESNLKSAWTKVYDYEMPGGQYSNIQMQAQSMNLGDQFDEVLEMYHRVNLLFGDIVKVTPSSKVVGDMALFMVQNKLDEDSLFEKGKTLDFPDSVVSFFKGEIGQPARGMNEALRQLVLKGQTYSEARPGSLLDDYDFEAARQSLSQQAYNEIEDHDLLSLALYPKVYKDYLKFVDEYGQVTVLDSPTFFYGLKPYEKIAVVLEEGKTLLIELTSIGPVNETGQRPVYFNLNGMPEQVIVQDQNAQTGLKVRPKADSENPNHIGAQMPGSVYKIEVKQGQAVESNQVLMITEAMKMETAIRAPKAGHIKAIHCQEKEQIVAGDLLIEIE